MHRVRHQVRANAPRSLLHRREEEVLVCGTGGFRAVQLLQNGVSLLPRRCLARQRLAETLRSRDLLDRLEVLDGLDLQLERGVFVYDDHGVWVLLQGGQSPHVVDAVFDALFQREGFVSAGDDDNDFAGVENGLHADCEGHAWDLSEVVVEEAGVGLERIVCEGLHASPRL